MSRPKLFFVMTYRNSVIRNSVIRKLGYKKHDSLVPTRFSLGYKKLFISLIYPIVAKIVGTPQMTWQPVFSIPLSSLFSYRLVNLTNNKSLMSYISCCHSGRVGSSPPTRAKKIHKLWIVNERHYCIAEIAHCNYYNLCVTKLTIFWQNTLGIHTKYLSDPLVPLFAHITLKLQIFWYTCVNRSVLYSADHNNFLNLGSPDLFCKKNVLCKTWRYSLLWREIMNETLRATGVSANLIKNKTKLLHRSGDPMFGKL